MGKHSIRKGKRFEREIVQEARAAGLRAERAYASNGEALGEAEGVDVVFGGLRAQAKRRKRVSDHLTPPDGADAVVIREDRGESLAVVPLDLLCELLRKAESSLESLLDGLDDV